MLNFKASSVPLLSCEKTLGFTAAPVSGSEEGGCAGAAPLLCWHVLPHRLSQGTAAVWPGYPQKKPSVKDYPFSYFISMQKTQQNQVLIRQSHHGHTAGNSSKILKVFVRRVLDCLW